MNNFFSFLLIFTIVFSSQTRYWSLGLIIKNQPNKKIIQKEIDLNNFIVDKPKNHLEKNNPNNIYTLKTNYFIEPQSIDSEESEAPNNFKKRNITDLILEEEYFEAAKQIIYLEENNFILEEFQNWEDFYYWSSFVYYNLGNYNIALENINKISTQYQNPETLFLKALAFRDYGKKTESNLILNHIIKEFSDNDYANYARDLLNDE